MSRNEICSKQMRSCKECKTTVLIVKYANLWRACQHHHHGCLSLLQLTKPNVTNVKNKASLAVETKGLLFLWLPHLNSSTPFSFILQNWGIFPHPFRFNFVWCHYRRTVKAAAEVIWSLVWVIISFSPTEQTKHFYKKECRKTFTWLLRLWIYWRMFLAFLKRKHKK